MYIAVPYITFSPCENMVHLRHFSPVRAVFVLIMMVVLGPDYTHGSPLRFYGNQSTIRWRTVETDNFLFHYPAQYREHAERVVAFAEAVHDSVQKRYRVRLPGKVNLVLRNALFSNGQANPVYNTMSVWLTDWDFKLRSTHDWKRDVITHEFAHLVSIQSGSKLPPFIHGMQITKTDYPNESVRADMGVLFPFMQMPLWFAEGTAQYESARLGYDAWDNHRDMLLRTAVLEDALLPLSQMYAFTDNALESELGPYNQGFSLVLYMVEKYGDRVIPDLWSELSRMHRVTFSAALEKVVGIDEQRLYQSWRAHLLQLYQARRDALGTLVTGHKRTAKSFYQDFPLVVDGHLYGISNFGGPHFDGKMFKIPLPLDTALDDSGWVKLSKYNKSGFKPQKAWLEKGFSVRAVAGGLLGAYVTFSQRDGSGRAYFDIAIDDTSAGTILGQRPRLRLATRMLDAVYPDLSPDASQVVFVRREKDGTRFVLSVAPVPAVGELPGEYRDLVVPPAGIHTYGIYTPRWSPDGQRIAFSFYDGVSRKIGVVDANGQNPQVLVAGPFDARDPVWSVDGKFLIYSCDRSGIFNLYQRDMDNNSEHAITRVLGGAFSPTVDSTDIYYIGYDKDGFSLFHLPSVIGKKDTIEQPPNSEDSADNNVRGKHLSVGSVELQGVERSYIPLPLQPVLVPLLSMEGRSGDFRQVERGIAVVKGGVALGLSDPLHKNFIQLALLLELGEGFDYVGQSGLDPSKQSDLLASWENRSFPITLRLDAMRSNSASRDTLRYEDVRSAGDSVGITHHAVGISALEAGAGYSVFKEGDSISVSLGQQWAEFNLYQEGFRWDYLKRRHLGLIAGWEKGYNPEAVAGSGTGISVGWQHSRSDLFRPGTFAESFRVSPQGAILPRYREFTLDEVWWGAWTGISNPLHKKARLALGMSGSAILDWEDADGTDTLDSFFSHGLFLAGYPMLANAENLLISGERTAKLQAHYLFPLWDKMGLTWWIFHARSLYANVFADAGTAWEGSWRSANLQQRSTWLRSAGLELRLSARIFYSYPLETFVQMARGLDRVMIQGNWQHLEPLDIPLLPAELSFTRIHVGIGFSLPEPARGAYFATHPLQARGDLRKLR